jgi:hypothetical protein
VIATRASRRGFRWRARRVLRHDAPMAPPLRRLVPFAAGLAMGLAAITAAAQQINAFLYAMLH